MIRILVGHRDALLRGALAAVLAAEEDLKVVAESARGDELLAVAQRDQPDMVVLDIHLPGTGTVVELCESLREALPDCGVLIVLDQQACVAVGGELAQLAPRVGLLATEASPRELVTGVRQLARGEPVLDAKLALAALTAKMNPFTEREREILRLAIGGAPAKEIATILYLSTGTVRNYLSRIIAKTGARSRIEAIRIAQEAGWI